jgi:excisionase family DNA binding protein
MSEMEKQAMAAVALLLTTAEAAELLGVKSSTLEQWRWQGIGPKFIKMNRAVRYRRDDLQAFVEARVFGSTTEAQAEAR